MAAIHRKILSYVIVSAPKPVVNIDIPDFENGIFDVSATIWWILGYQSLVLLAKQSKSKLQVGEDWLTHTVQSYLLIVINIYGRGRESVFLSNTRVFYTLVAYVFRYVATCPTCRHLSKMKKKCRRFKKTSCIMSATYVGSTGDKLAPSALIKKK